jgi:hypothetical protein
MADKPTKDDELDDSLGTDRPQEATPTPREIVAPSTQTYFFPPDFSCEATSLAEATKQFEDHQKGIAQPA